jgi:hypothetical protein
MNRAGRNPTRRNRNIGTAKSGHGQDNRLVIPDPRADIRPFWEKLRDPVRVEVDGFTLVVEPPQPGFIYAVTVEDVVHMLGMLPPDDVALVRAFVLRQPTRKQRLLAAVWGRLVYRADFGGASGPAVILEAQRPRFDWQWPRSLGPEDAEELARLRADGHWVIGDRSWRIRSDRSAIRATQLYRTLPHEIGHLVHYEREVRLRAGGDLETESALRDLYFTKPSHEKEAFAHRYAREAVERLRAEHRLRFARLADETRLSRWRLDPGWFGLT